jgi:hypothetical protein
VAPVLELVLLVRVFCASAAGRIRAAATNVKSSFFMLFRFLFFDKGYNTVAYAF